MMPHVLDHPIRNALLTRHSHFAEGGTGALRYRPDVSSFASATDTSGESLAGLAALIAPGSTAILAQRDPHPVPPGTVAELVAEAVQMLAVTVSPPDRMLDFLELSDADAPEMLALATLTKPGPYLARTHDFGGYIGIRVDGRLAAMAGYRLKVPGFTEISAVCTHPDFRGQGYASFLMRVLAARITAEGDVPFLHTFASNTNAIRLYEELGFVLRTGMWVSVLRRA